MRLSAAEALDRLAAGNRRFVSGARTVIGTGESSRGYGLVDGQSPFAVILGCSDSRVPVEIVFDQGPGDLFVVRVAGNITAPSQVQSIEFAVEAFDVPLVVVLGHTLCGAVAHAVEQIMRPEPDRSTDYDSIVAHIRPSIEALLEEDPDAGPERLARRAVRANVRTSAEHLGRRSDRLAKRVRDGDLVVLGAEYALQSGVVDFFDGAP